MTSETPTCYHCASALDARAVRAELAAIERSFCCAGCLAAAQWLHEGGLGDFYRLRSAPSLALADAAEPDYRAWDSPAFHALYVRASSITATPDGIREIDVALDGLRCPACAWLIPRLGQGIDGVLDLQLNTATGRARLRWDPSRVALSGVLGKLAQYGYFARVALQGSDQQRADRRSALKRIAVAGIAAMQAMMMSEALYFGGDALEHGTRDFLRWMALLMSTPVVFWAAAGFFRGAWLELCLRRPGMDVLVALSVGLAYGTSVVETLRGGPVVYFDAAVMFVFFLLVARYIESSGRIRAQAAISRAQSLPATVTRISAEGPVEVSLLEVGVGDLLQVAVGQNVPVDGRLVHTAAEVDERLLTGEPRPQLRRPGDQLLAGSIVLGSALHIRVSAIGAATWLAQLETLVGRAQQARPALQLRAQVWAARFVIAMIALAAVAALIWWQIDASRALPVALAVLAAACPCAFALAIPAAQAAAQAALARSGVLVVHADALERAARVRRVVFDKTGTLSRGKPQLGVIEVFDRSKSTDECTRIAAALERGHRHPLAEAFRQHDDGAPVEQVRSHVGDGVSGVLAGVHYRLGRRGFVEGAGLNDDGRVWLASAERLLAAFELHDALRPDAADSVAQLMADGIDSLVLSGDASATVRGVAEELSIRRARGDLRPEQKLALLQAEQRSGYCVAMVGDGINDAPVLAAADLAVVMGEGAALAQRNADILLLRPNLILVPQALAMARRTQRIIRQNLVWSLAYHVLMLPAALSGVMPPWLAAVGMSLSSLLVSLNAARLLRGGPADPPKRLRASASASASAVAVRA